MKLTDFDGLQSSNYEVVMNLVKENAKPGVMHALRQLDPTFHDVMSVQKRPNKIITISDPEDPDNPAKDIKKRVEVARLTIPFQKLITGRAAAFLCGNPITYEHGPMTAPEEDFFTVFQKVMDDNKVEYKNLDIAYKMMGETEAAEIWYPEPVEDKDPDYWFGTPADGAKFRLRMKVIANSLGDQLYAVFDEYGDMIAFGRGYSVKEGKMTYEHFDIYTAKMVYYGARNNLSTSWTVETEVNVVGKIPVIYYCQEKPEWHDVQRLIDRLELMVSNQADTNDYFTSPALIVKGMIAGFSSKGETGKVFEITNGQGDMEYLTWDRASESAKNELEWVTKMIYDMTDTPNISMQEMKALNAFSGIAIKLLFLAAHMKSATKQGIFGESVQRRFNFVTAAIVKIKSSLAAGAKLRVKPGFKFFMPENTAEIIDMLSVAVAGEPVMSQKTAVDKNPLVNDPGAEFQEMTDEGKVGPAVSVV